MPPKQKPIKKKPRSAKGAKNRHWADVVANFVRTAMTFPHDTVFIGIDPGTTGAIAFRCNKAYDVVDIPVTVTKVKRTRKTTRKEKKASGKKSKTIMAEDRQFDLGSIVKLFRLLKHLKDRVKVILEKVPPKAGRQYNYSDVILNRAYGMWPLFLTTKGYELYERRPTEWKARMDLLSADKEQSRQKALKLFPAADCPLKKHHNRAEALLLCEALRRELKIGTQV